jgi:hypothetical protein
MANAQLSEKIPGLTIDGREIRACVFNENEVRAVAGLTLVIAAVAFSYAYFARVYEPIRIVTAVFFVEFLLRLTLGLRYSPIAMMGRLLIRRQQPHWVSAKPKRRLDTPGEVQPQAEISINCPMDSPMAFTAGVLRRDCVAIRSSRSLSLSGPRMGSLAS